MAASTIAAVVIFASIGLVALALGLLARRYSGRALAIGLIGLLALTTASTWMTYAGPNTSAQNKELLSSREQIKGLEGRIESGRAELDKAQQEVAKAKAEAEQLRAELQDQRAEVGELRKKLSEAQLPPPSPPQPVPTPINSELRRKLASRIDTPFYTSQPLEQRTLVAGLTGSWYVIRPKLGGKSLVFADGQFRLPEAVQELTESALQLHNDLLAPIRQVAKSTRLFLRGAADYRRLLGAPKALDARELQILKRLPDETYGAVPRRLPQSAHVRNEDLPNLRADWLSQHIRSALPLGSADITILENPPATGHERTVDLILYVEW
jgi:hypothetical protein